MKQEDMDKMHYKTQQECIDGMQAVMRNAGIIFAITILAVVFIIPIHFACVLYHHWQNADKPAEEGGIQDD